MEKKVKCSECQRYDAHNGWCTVTARVVTRDSLRNCKYHLEERLKGLKDEADT